MVSGALSYAGLPPLSSVGSGSRLLPFQLGCALTEVTALFSACRTQPFTRRVSQVSSSSLWLVFSFSYQCLLKREALNFGEVQFIKFLSFMVCIFGVMPKKSLPAPGF